MHIMSLRKHPEYLSRAIGYFQDKWATPESRTMYEDCLTHCIGAVAPLPQWYLLLDEAQNDAQSFGFSHVHLCTDLTGYYEKYGFAFMGMGYHPWGEASRVYGKAVG